MYSQYHSASQPNIQTDELMVRSCRDPHVSPTFTRTGVGTLQSSNAELLFLAVLTSFSDLLQQGGFTNRDVVG
jgi:hypothetical protein